MNEAMIQTKAAAASHEANRVYCESIGDASQPAWADAPDWQKDSALAGVRMIADDPTTTPEQSHESWSAHKRADGWVYGKAKDPVAKTHHCLVPYGDLPEAQRIKDAFDRAGSVCVASARSGARCSTGSAPRAQTRTTVPSGVPAQVQLRPSRPLRALG